MTLVELADRCEQETGSSYALDIDIWDAIYPGDREERWQAFLKAAPSSMARNLGPADRDGYIKPLRAFTASLDAAMTVVPEGHDMQINLYWGRDGKASATVSALKQLNLPRVFAATPPLALCAAALRVRAEGRRT